MSRLKKGSAIAAMAVALIGGFEGLLLYSYQDVVGVWTACYGETRGIRPGMKFTKPQCDNMLAKRLVQFENEMRACLRSPDRIPDKPYVAFLSLAYNIGTPKFCKSSIAGKVNAGDLRGACNAIPLYNKAGGRVWRGLVNRRADEKELCLEGLR